MPQQCEHRKITDTYYSMDRKIQVIYPYLKLETTTMIAWKASEVSNYFFAHSPCRTSRWKMQLALMALPLALEHLHFDSKCGKLLTTGVNINKKGSVDNEFVILLTKQQNFGLVKI